MSETLNMDQFNPKKNELIVLADEAKQALSIEIVDKKTYEQVHQAEMMLKEARISVEKTWKAMREDAIAFQKKVIEVEKDLVSVISPTEEALKAKKKAWNDEQERKKEEEARKAEEALNNRVQELAKYGYTPEDMFDLKIKTDEEFTVLLNEKKSLWEQAEEIRIRKENFEKMRTSRISRLFEIWMFFNGIWYTSSEVPSIMMTVSEMEQQTDEDFDANLSSFRARIEEARENMRKAREEQEKKDAELKAREDAIKQKEEEQKRKDEEEKRQAEIKKAQEEAAEKSRKETEERIQREADKKKKDEEYKKETERLLKEQEEKELEKKRKYVAFLQEIGYKKEEDHLWKVEDTEEGREFYKKVGTFLRK